MSITTAYVGLGANLGDPRGQVLAAIEALDGIARTRVVARSNLYLTPPWGVLEQPEFVNAVVAVETALSAAKLLDSLQAIEARFGRVREGRRWGPRVLDLDLLLHGEARCRDADLTLPHPRIAERAFVLLPLADIAPDMQMPGLGTARRLLDRLDTRGCRRLPDDA